jgi:hypothetical protein
VKRTKGDFVGVNIVPDAEGVLEGADVGDNDTEGGKEGVEVGFLEIEGERDDTTVGCNEDELVSEGDALVLNDGLGVGVAVDGDELGGEVVDGSGVAAVGPEVWVILGIKVAVTTVNATSSLSSNDPIPQLPLLLVKSLLSTYRMLTRTTCSDPLGSV